jgi:hypothetical protein
MASLKFWHWLTFVNWIAATSFLLSVGLWGLEVKDTAKSQTNVVQSADVVFQKQL